MITVGRSKPAVPAVVSLLPTPSPDPDQQTVQVLTLARALIEDRKDWVRRRYETRHGRRCAVGAVRAARRMMKLEVRIHQPGAHVLLQSIAMSRGFNGIESMNDDSGHRQVLSAFDEAIDRARHILTRRARAQLLANQSGIRRAGLALMSRPMSMVGLSSPSASN